MLYRIDGPETKTGQITYRIVTDGVAVRRLNKNYKYDTVFELVTQLTDDNNLYDSMDDAVDDVTDDDRLDEPTRDVTC